MHDDYDEAYYGHAASSGPESHADSENDPHVNYGHNTVDIPDVIKQFLQYFCTVISERQLFEIQDLYENTFLKLTEEYYERTPWPDEKAVYPIVNGDPIFLILYKELYFRHLHAKLPMATNLGERFASFLNYCDFFNLILTSETPFPLVLPDVWLWELIDEFVYQFQSFTQYRSRPNKSAEEYEELQTNNKMWNVLCVLNVFHSLIDKSNIKKQLEVHASGGDADSVAGDFGRHSLYKMLGYFSLVGLLRLHSLLGDYYQAIKALENIDIHKKTQYSSVPACQITMSYYVGFGYMMMRRYVDAIRTFSGILLYLQRTKQLFQSRTYQNDQINKQTDQMYHLLIICLVLHPQNIDESLQQTLKEKNYHDKMIKMQYGDHGEFESSFMFACPKFLTPTPPPPEDIKEDHTKEPVRYQAQIFMEEVRQQKMLPTIRSYLKLYKTLPLSKLVSFMDSSRQDLDPKEREKGIRILITHLLCFKHKMKSLVWNKGTSGLDGTFQSGSELDFYIDNDMIHIADTKVATRHADVFIRKIHKFDELRRKIQSLRIQ